MRSALVLLALAGCLDPASPPPSSEPPAPRLMKSQPPSFDVEGARPPAREPVDTDARFEADVELRAPVRDGRLSLVPLVTDLGAPAQHFITLQAGLASGQVIATDTGAIETVMITNRAQEPLAILGGELLVGGLQDRLVVANAVVPAGKTFALTVVCAEPGRMAGGSRFRASHALAEPALRRLARANDQLAVWERIRAVSSGSYGLVVGAQRRGVNADRLRHLIAELDRVDRREERSQTVGFAVAVDGKVIAIEQFASAELFRDLRAMVIASYLPGSIGKPRATEEVTPEAVRTFKARRGGGGPPPSRSREEAPSVTGSVLH